MRTWLAVLLLAACSHEAPKSTTPPVAATGVTCDQMSAHIVQIMPANDGSNADLVKELTNVMKERCTADAWSPEARQCFLEMKDPKDAERCKPLLTKAQIDATDKAMDERLAKKSDAAPAAAPAEAPPPPPAPPPKTRGAQKKAPVGGGKAGKSGDPCEGGQ